jgi:clan AA aspartic protease
VGITKVSIKIINPEKPEIVLKDKFLVDSGASFTVIPANMAKKLELKPIYDKEFVLADGKVVKRKIGTAIISLNGTALPSPVVLGKKNDSKLLGALTLESHGLALDPFERRLYKAKLFM